MAVERAVVEEQEKIKDTEALAKAGREKKVAITAAEQKAEEELVMKIKAAEADKQASQLFAQKKIIEANAAREAADKEAESTKILADAMAAEHAAIGLAEAKVLEAKAAAKEKEGAAEANVLEQKALAEAKGIELKGDAQAEANEKLGMVQAKLDVEQGLAEAKVIEAKAEAIEKQGSSEASVIEKRGLAEAKGVAAKAEAMQKLDGVGKEHEEFKLRLEKEKDIELAHINIQKEIAAAQASVIAEALKAANIDIVGGEVQFFDRITQAITHGKSVDRLIGNSHHLLDLKEALLHVNGSENGNGSFGDNLKRFIGQFNVNTEDIRNLSVSALIVKMMTQTESDAQKSVLQKLLTTAEKMGIAEKSIDTIVK